MWVGVSEGSPFLRFSVRLAVLSVLAPLSLRSVRSFVRSFVRWFPFVFCLSFKILDVRWLSSLVAFLAFLAGWLVACVGGVGGWVCLIVLSLLTARWPSVVYSDALWFGT